MAGECDTECTCGTVADAFGNFGDTPLFSPQQVLGHRHAPPQQVLHRGDAHGAAEPLEERRAGKGGLFCQLRNRPGLGHTFVHAAYRDRETFVGKPTHQAWRRRGPGRGAQRFDQKNLQQA